MSTHEVMNMDRDPKTGHFLPGHRVSSGEAKYIAQRMSELKRNYLQAVQPEDAAEVYREHMKCVRQDDDLKLKLAALALWYERNFGKAVETVNISSDTRATTVGLNLTSEEQVVLERIIEKNGPAALTAGD